jgi:hypothetical protein
MNGAMAKKNRNIMKYHEISRYGGSQKFLSHPITETTWDVDICGSLHPKGRPASQGSKL